MTFKEKLAQIHPHLVGDEYIGGCVGCPHKYPELNSNEDECPYNVHGSGGCTKCWNREIPAEGSAVNHPKHYGREGAIECIDEMLLVFGKEATLNFCLLNAWKYRYRAADKNGAEDIEKSDWYMNKYKELKGGD